MESSESTQNFSSLFSKLDPSAVRELDRIAIEDGKVPGLMLMERASQSLFTEVRTHFSEAIRVGGVRILAGKGNNGGDGLRPSPDTSPTAATHARCG